MKISDQSIIEVNWNVLPVDYTKEMEKNIKVKCAKKYGVPESNVKVNPNFIMINENGEKIALTNDTIVNIQDPKFQVKIFKQYLEINNVENFDWEYIKSIDAEINSEIDYNVYDKYKKYSLKWIKWSNFLSYGKDNYFDFTKLKGMVLVNGKPSNQSGKTTFSIELLRFLLFGKTSKFKTLEGNFNVNLPEETEMTVEGQIEIDGENFIIKRTVSRPSLKKRSSKSKVQQKVEYYKVLDNGDTEELYDVIENCQEESGLKTNIAIKEAIGNEQDFDLVICATNENLRDLINFKETERGRLLSRWIGLLPIEEKERENIEDSTALIERQRSTFQNIITASKQWNSVLSYSKVHTCDFSEERNLTPGDDFRVATLDTGHGKIETGAMICYDREFPESARILMLKGAELVLVPNACPMEINRLSQLRARAFENMMAIATCNYPASVPDCNGESTVFDGVAYLPEAEGSRDTCILHAGSDEGIYLASLDLDILRRYRETEVHGNAYRHPGKYRALIEEGIREPFIRSDYRS